MLDDFEQGEWLVKVRRKAWQVWLPETISLGTYTRIGNNIQLISRNFPAGVMPMIVVPFNDPLCRKPIEPMEEIK